MKTPSFRTFFVFVFLGLFFCMMSCTSKQSPINDLADLAERVQQNSSSFSEDDWRAVVEDIKDIEKEMEQYKSEYTPEDAKEISRLKGIIYGCYTKSSVTSIRDGIERTIKEAEGLVDGFLKGITREDDK